MVRLQTGSARPGDDLLGLPLRQAVFDKLFPAFGGRKRLLLAPDGDLTKVPFEVLPTQDGRRLIDEYAISYLACARDVLRFETASTSQATAPLVVGDPDFDLVCTEADLRAQTTKSQPRHSRDLDSCDYSFERLSGTRAEAERVASLLGVRPWLGDAALEGRLKKECRSPRILHLATHGFFLKDQKGDAEQEPRDPEVLGVSEGSKGRLSGQPPENPFLRSGLALAGANTWLRHNNPPAEAEDGLLTAEDVANLDLSATELVVLSACETGLGTVRIREGVFGLRRAVVLAGAKTLVMSLWKVPDEQTQELMEDYYRRVLAGQGRAQALREAQLALKAKCTEPLYWGAFICQGDPGPLVRRA
ncbi:MAG: CHAT domain-containing protein [Isosphaerales bacterium]